MKKHPLLIMGLFVAVLLVPVLLADPCVAAFIPGNAITLERDGMAWDYEEKITENESVFFRNLIDRETGNSNGFVNAWEILKMEVSLSNKMKKAIKEEPDVRLNSTLDTVELRDVEFSISREALGKTEKSSSITNYASVTYSFKEGTGPGTAISLTGTPDSNVTIILPPGFDAELTEGLDNKNSGFENDRTVLSGNFGSEKNITLWLSENESFKAEILSMKVADDTAEESESEAGKNTTLNSRDKAEVRQSSEFFKNILKEINRSL